MIDAALLQRLRQIVGAEHVFTGRADAEVYSYDASQAVGTPEAVVLPADSHETADVVRAAVDAGVPYIPRGFGTNLSGGSIAPSGGLVIGLSRLNRLLEVHPESRYAVVQPGMTNLELQEALAPIGFYYAPDPASQKIATLGGNLGENAGGPHCLKYGVTTNHILGMTMVLPDGRMVHTGGPALDGPGYDLRGVLVGSEGTLAVVTELVVRILPLPESVVTLLAVYDDVADAARSVSDIIAAGIVPATLEMMDSTVIRAVEESKPCGYPVDAAAVLIAEVDGPATGLARQAERVGEFCTRNGCREVRTAKDDAERDLLWAGRRGAFGALARVTPNFLVADCTVPRNRLPEAIRQVAAVAKRHGVTHANVFHAGDGNLHPVLFFDSRVADEVERARAAGEEVMAACVGLGGTITGEHGVGVEKAHGMRLVFSEDDLDIQRALRRALDPGDLLNPGKIFPPRQPEDDRPEPPTVDLQPGSELAPADAIGVCGVVRRAYLDGVALAPVGSGTRRDFGNLLHKPAVLLRSTALDEIVHYDPDNQVIAVGAGMSLCRLQETLAAREQWLPLRPPRGDRRTLGGIAALGDCGPERLRYGAARDMILGMKFVSGAGRLISAGGQVVKNVAGYDLTRLLVGSAGTLGLITELTLRVAAVPKQCTAVRADGPITRCRAAAAELLGSKLEPNLIVATPEDPALKLDDHRDTTGDDGPWRLIAGFEGFPETVAFQVESCREMFAKAGLKAREPQDYHAVEGMCGEFFRAIEPFPFVLRVDVPPAESVAVLSALQEVLRGASVLVDPGCGRILAGLEWLDPGAWLPLCRKAAEAQGHAILEKAPESFKQEQDVFGPPRPDWPVMHRIKAELDPRGVFAPGRLPGGNPGGC